tara:strand:+ start:43 stop:627 length:585 start_codon:yes stop_codon:yes gene_type:complete
MVRKKDVMDLKEQFSKAWNYVKESQWSIYFVILVFIVSASVGFFYSEQFTFLNKLLEELILRTQGLNMLEMIFFIMQNNLLSALSGLVFGAIFGIFPLIGALVNGVVLGYVMSLVFDVAGIGEFWRLLPHGIFEMTAIFIALGLGVHFGGFIFAKDKKKEFKRRFFEGINAFFMIILPLLMIAAVIEGVLIFLV